MDFSKERLEKNEWPGPGEFYAPAWIARLLVRLLEFRGDGTLYDPCCGSGAMLLQAARCAPGLRLFGQVGDARMRRTCQANLRLHDLWADLGDRAADALTEDLHAGEDFDCILANPPFNQSDWCDRDSVWYDARWRYGPPLPSNANFAWLQHVVSHLSERGRAAVLLPNGSLTARTRAERLARRGMVEDGLVEAIVTMPSGIFRGTRVPFCIWLLGRNRAVPTTLIADAGRLMGERRTPSGEDFSDLERAVCAHRDGVLKAAGEWYAVASIEEIARRDFLLSPNFYLRQPRACPEPAARDGGLDAAIDALKQRGGSDPAMRLLERWRGAPPAGSWSRMPLLEAYEARGGVMKGRDAFRKGTGTPMADVRTVIRHAFLPEELPARVEVDAEELRKYRICAGDVLLNRTSETVEELACGCVALRDRDAVFGGYLKRLRPVRGERLNPCYMAAYFRSGAYRREVRGACPAFTTRANMNMAALSRISIYYPDRAAQDRIGDTMRAACEWMGRCEDPRLAELLERFLALFLEKYVTLPALRLDEEVCGE